MKQLGLKAVLLVCLLICGGCGSTEKKETNTISGLDSKEEVTIKIAIPYETDKALNNISNTFMNRYPNVDVQLIYIEDYDKNSVELFKAGKVDFIFKKDCVFEEETIKDEKTDEKVKTGKTTADYYYNFLADEELDFSGTTADISDNYRHVYQDEQGNEVLYQYCYPLGGETRGIFVNVSLLKEHGLSTPTNFDEFLACCEKLKEDGLIAIQGGADTSAYGLGIALAANGISHDEAVLEDVAQAKEGISHYFEDVISKIYTLSTHRYIDYKALEDSGLLTSTSESAQVENFLGLRTNKDTFEISAPDNNIGYTAFFPYISSTEAVIQTMIERYQLDTEFTFICSPLNDEGENSPVYITPYYGLCLNKNSDVLDWGREFINFIFEEENNKAYSKDASLIPNTKDALEVVGTLYNVDVDKDVTVCGKIRFSNQYNGFTPIASGLKDVAKCNAKKYMVNLNKDGQGNIQYEIDENGKEYLLMGNGETKVYKEDIGLEDDAMPGYAFCKEEYYIQSLEKYFAKYRE